MLNIQEYQPPTEDGLNKIQRKSLMRLAIYSFLKWKLFEFA